jgi:hypothetical protein
MSRLKSSRFICNTKEILKITTTNIAPIRKVIVATHAKLGSLNDASTLLDVEHHVLKNGVDPESFIGSPK